MSFLHPLANLPFFITFLCSIKRYKLSPVQAGSLLVPSAVSAILGGFWGGIYIKQKGKYYNMFANSNAILALGTLPILFLTNATMRFVQVALGISICLFIICFVNGIMISSFYMVLGEYLPRSPQRTSDG